MREHSEEFKKKRENRSEDWKKGYNAGYGAKRNELNQKKKIKDFNRVIVKNNSAYYPADEFVCSNCGLRIEDWRAFEVEDGRENAYEFEFKFCPKCGGIVD